MLTFNDVGTELPSKSLGMRSKKWVLHFFTLIEGPDQFCSYVEQFLEN